MTAMGRTVLQTINALDNGPQVARAEPYLLFQGKVIPAWAIRLLVLALILPVLVATIDGLARARRRGHSICRWLRVGARRRGPVRARGAADRGGARHRACSIPLRRRRSPAAPCRCTRPAIALLIVLADRRRPRVLCAAATRDLARRRRTGAPGSGTTRATPGAAAALLLVMCLAALAIWVTNPFAAALVVPALHLWMWVVDPDVRLHPAGALSCCSVASSRRWSDRLLRPLAVGSARSTRLERRAADRRRAPHDRRRDRVERAPGVSRQRRAHRRGETQRAASRGRSGHRARPDHLRRPGSLGGTESGPSDDETAHPRHLLGADHLRAAAGPRRRRDAGLAGAGDGGRRADQAQPDQQALPQLPQRAADAPDLHALARCTRSISGSRSWPGASSGRSTTGAAIGRIEITKIGASFDIVQGTDTASLEKGPGHYPATAFPGLGQTVAIAGHRTTYLAPFRHIDALAPGDRIVVKMPYGVHLRRPVPQDRAADRAVGDQQRRLRPARAVGLQPAVQRRAADHRVRPAGPGAADRQDVSAA